MYSMNRLMAVTIIGFISGMVGTGLGGLLVFFLQKPSKRFMGILLGFTSGIMLSAVCFDLLPEAFEIGGMVVGLIGILLGVFIILIIENFIPDNKGFSNNNISDFVKSGILMGIGIALHNFPEGLAVGSGFAANNSLGLGLAIVIGLHDMPEGIAMAAPLKIGGMNSFKILIYTILAGIPNGIGAFIGALLGQISPVFISMCLGFAGGAMLYITCGQLIPKTQAIYRGRISTLGMIAGIMTGIVIAYTF